MKRFIAKVLTAALLLSILTLPLTSCSGIKSSLTGFKDSLMIRVLEGEEKAAYLMELSDRRLAEADSYTMVQNSHVRFEIEGVPTEQKDTATITCVDDGETYFRVEENKSDMWVGSDEKTTWYRDVGYVDGMMFTQYKSDDDQTRLKSPISAEDFKAWLENRSDGMPEISVTEDVCNTISCVEAEDGSWTVTCEDFTEEGLKPFLYLIRGMDQAFTEEYDITDVLMTATLDEDYYPVGIVMEFEFTEIGNASSRVPELSVEATYGSWNSVTEEEATRKLGSYNEVEDIRHIEAFLSALKDRKTATRGSFTVTTVSGGSYDGETFRSEQSREVTFESGDDYTFTLDFTDEGSVYAIEYKNGKMTTRVTDENSGRLKDTQTETMSRGTAQLTVNQLMDPETLSGIDLNSVTCVNAEAGKYRFGLSPVAFAQLNEELGEAYGGSVKSLEGYVDATIVDGKLMSYACHVDITLGVSVTSYLELKMNITSDMTVTFHDVVDSENESADV